MTFVRVKDKETGHEYSVDEARYDLTPDLWDKLDKPATDSAGTPLPAKHRVSKGTTTKTGRTAASEKETN